MTRMNIDMNRNVILAMTTNSFFLLFVPRILSMYMPNLFAVLGEIKGLIVDVAAVVVVVVDAVVAPVVDGATVIVLKRSVSASMVELPVVFSGSEIEITKSIELTKHQ